MKLKLNDGSILDVNALSFAKCTLVVYLVGNAIFWGAIIALALVLDQL